MKLLYVVNGFSERDNVMSCVEIGGYLPLELQKGKSFFRNISPKYIAEVNTGRTALALAIEGLNVNKVYIPYFYCADVISVFENLDIEVRYYHIGEDMLPIDLYDESDAAFVLVNYFGCLEKSLKKYQEKFEKVIIDNAHSFFSEPIMREGLMNVYSCRKFFGVCDGSYLIGENIPQIELEKDVSYTRAIHLLKSIELGTNEAYQENKYNEVVLGEARLGMSVLTKAILDGIDYEEVRNRRLTNFRYLHNCLSDIQLLNNLQENSVAYMYPLLLDKDIHKCLVDNRVYVPYLWAHLLEEEWEGTVEYQCSKYIVPLPMDQRYSEKELSNMIEIIRMAYDKEE